jgi:4-amino-4-deoxy-L-arabinose transferase-like glycosyltransferase
MPTTGRHQNRVLPITWWLVAGGVFALVIVIRIRLLGMPLERDEGEYAYAGQLILQGVPPYSFAYNMKFPGTYAAYAAIISVFGQTINGIHSGLLLVNALTILLIFLLGRRLANCVVGLVGASSYAVLSVSPSVLGLAGHATHFVVLPVLAGILLLLDASDRYAYTRLFASGVLFGVGLVMKQPAIFFIPVGIVYLAWNDVRRKRAPKDILLRSLVFGIGAITPLVVTCLILWRSGVIDKFWFWTINYAGQYGSILINEIKSGRWPLSQAAQFVVGRTMEAIGAGWMLWALAGLGLIAGLADRKSRTTTGFLLGLLLFSGLSVAPGLYFRPHYFVMMLPAVSLLAGVAIGELSHFLTHRIRALRFVPVFLIAVALSIPILRYARIFFEASPDEACRIIYPDSPFVESVKIGNYLREHSSTKDTIAVLGSEPEIYFYSQRRSATGYIYTYGLMEPQTFAQQMQKEMIREMENASPEYLVSVPIFDSWLWRPASDRSIFNWANEYAAKNYAAAGFVNITPKGTDYYFGDVPASVETPKNYIVIYKRNP